MNKLAEYIDASALRRKRILQALKYPQDSGPGGLWYRDARASLTSFLITDDWVALEASMNRLKSEPANSEFQAALANASLGAIEIYLSNVHDLLPDLSPYQRSAFREPGRANPKLMIEGVEVSVAPDVVLQDADGKIGLIKFHMAKSHQLTDTSGPIAALLLQVFVEEQLAGTPSLPNCLALDVFNQLRTLRVFCAPKSSKRRMSEIAANCEEIFSRWDSVSPP